jgi:hypothetical protein
LWPHVNISEPTDATLISGMSESTNSGLMSRNIAIEASGEIPTNDDLLSRNHHIGDLMFRILESTGNNLHLGI